jgi:hypothetical protein
MEARGRGIADGAVAELTADQCIFILKHLKWGEAQIRDRRVSRRKSEVSRGSGLQDEHEDQQDAHALG